GLRTKAQRRIDDREYIRALLDLELKIGGQVGQEPAAGIVGAYHDRVSHDILRHTRVEANLADDAAKRLAWICVDGEPDQLALVNVADVGLVYRSPDFHSLQIFREQKEARRVEAGDNCLADVH